MNHFEIIHFSFFGLDLQEPMALVTNWLIASFCFYAFVKLRKEMSEEVILWRKFFLFLAISTLMGGIGHLFFVYFGMEGKYPNWVTGIIAGYFAGSAMLVRLQNLKVKKALQVVLIVKALVFLTLSIAIHNFVFIAVDSIVTYLLFCGVIGFIQYRKGIDSMKFMVYGVLVCLPSAFIFLLKLNPHRWLNKDDLSHLLMLGCAMCFYMGAKRLGKQDTSMNEQLANA